MKTHQHSYVSGQSFYLGRERQERRVAVTYCDEGLLLCPLRSVETWKKKQPKVEQDLDGSLTTCNSAFMLRAAWLKGHSNPIGGGQRH